MVIGMVETLISLGSYIDGIPTKKDSVDAMDMDNKEAV